jgi:hypothetical protein
VTIGGLSLEEEDRHQQRRLAPGRNCPSSDHRTKVRPVHARERFFAYGKSGERALFSRTRVALFGLGNSRARPAVRLASHVVVTDLSSDGRSARGDNWSNCWYAKCTGKYQHRVVNPPDAADLSKSGKVTPCADNHQ